MTGLLLKLYLKNTDINSKKGRAAVGRLSGTVGIFANLLLALLKLFIGTVSGSISVTADAMNNLSDASGSVVTLIGFKLAEKPADPDHPYGHARFEYLSGLLIAALIILIGFELAKSSVSKIINPTAVTFSVPFLVVLLFSVATKLWLSVFNKKLGKMINSGTLIATSADSRNDVIATVAVLVAAIIEHFSGLKVDGYIGLGVSVFILYSGVTIAKETINPLLGENASPELKKSIVEVVTSNEKVLGYHDLMVHDYGPNQRFASLHVEMDVKEDPMLCHGIIDDLERECMRLHNVNLVIHYDPIVTGDERLDFLRNEMKNILNEFDERLSFHDFRIVDGSDYTNIIFDVALPFGVLDKDVKKHIDESLSMLGDKKYYTVITFDSADFNTEH